jgi:hypothetical protein
VAALVNKVFKSLVGTPNTETCQNRSRTDKLGEYVELSTLNDDQDFNP